MTRRTAEGKKAIGGYVEEEIVRFIEETAREEDRPMSQVMERMLRSALEKEGWKFRKTVKNGRTRWVCVRPKDVTAKEGP